MCNTFVEMTKAQIQLYALRYCDLKSIELMEPEDLVRLKII